MPAVRRLTQETGSTDIPGIVEEDDPPIRVMALHALAYCERLFYLKEVEENHRVRPIQASPRGGRRGNFTLA